MSEPLRVRADELEVIACADGTVGIRYVTAVWQEALCDPDKAWESLVDEDSA